MMCGIVENQVPERMATVAVCKNSKKNRILHTNMSLFMCFLRQGMLDLPEYC